MALSRTQIIDLAVTTLREQGLAGLSMRRLAQKLGVQPGALYHHVASKQELLAAVGERILSENAPPNSTADPAQSAADLRAALLPIRDGAEVISFVHAYKPDAVGRLRNLQLSLAQRLPPAQAALVAEALIRYVLGFVAVEQNRAELIRARILDPGLPTPEPSDAPAPGPSDAPAPALSDLPTPDPEAAFSFGVRALLAGPEGSFRDVRGSGVGA